MPMPFNRPVPAVPLLDEDGKPAIHAASGLPLYTGRCGNQITGLRTDELPANRVIAVPVGERVVGVEGAELEILGGGGGLFGGGTVRGPNPPGSFPETPAGPAPPPGVPVVGPSLPPTRLEPVKIPVYAGRPCTTFALGPHFGLPVGAQSGGLSVYADGCVPCVDPPPPSCNCVFHPNSVSVHINFDDYGATTPVPIMRNFPRRFVTAPRFTTVTGTGYSFLNYRTDAFPGGQFVLRLQYLQLGEPSPPVSLEISSPLFVASYRRLQTPPGCAFRKVSGPTYMPADLTIEARCGRCGGGSLPGRLLCTTESVGGGCACLDGLSFEMTPTAYRFVTNLLMGSTSLRRQACGFINNWMFKVIMQCGGQADTIEDWFVYPWVENQPGPVEFATPIALPREPGGGPRGQARFVMFSQSPLMIVYEFEMEGDGFIACGGTVRMTITNPA